jgi:hypothetical protein
MKPPPLFEQYSPQGKCLYCLLLKAIYGLKQGSRQWYLKLSKVMKNLGFKKVRSEPCVYIFLHGDDRVIVPTLAESPIPSFPDCIAVDSDEESDDPLAMRAMEDLEHGLLSMAGIEYVLATPESMDTLHHSRKP